MTLKSIEFMASQWCKFRSFDEIHRITRKCETFNTPITLKKLRSNGKPANTGLKHHKNSALIPNYTLEFRSFDEIH